MQDQQQPQPDITLPDLLSGPFLQSSELTELLGSTSFEQLGSLSSFSNIFGGDECMDNHEPSDTDCILIEEPEEEEVTENQKDTGRQRSRDSGRHELEAPNSVASLSTLNDTESVRLVIDCETMPSEDEDDHINDTTPKEHFDSNYGWNGSPSCSSVLSSRQSIGNLSQQEPRFGDTTSTERQNLHLLLMSTKHTSQSAHTQQTWIQAQQQTGLKRKAEQTLQSQSWLGDSSSITQSPKVPKLGHDSHTETNIMGLSSNRQPREFSVPTPSSPPTSNTCEEWVRQTTQNDHSLNQTSLRSRHNSLPSSALRDFVDTSIYGPPPQTSPGPNSQVIVGFDYLNHRDPIMSHDQYTARPQSSNIPSSLPKPQSAAITSNTTQSHCTEGAFPKPATMFTLNQAQADFVPQTNSNGNFLPTYSVNISPYCESPSGMNDAEDIVNDPNQLFQGSKHSVPLQTSAHFPQQHTPMAQHIAAQHTLPSTIIEDTTHLQNTKHVQSATHPSPGTVNTNQVVGISGVSILPVQSSSTMTTSKATIPTSDGQTSLRDAVAQILPSDCVPLEDIILYPVQGFGENSSGSMDPPVVLPHTIQQNTLTTSKLKAALIHSSYSNTSGLANGTGFDLGHNTSLNLGHNSNPDRGHIRDLVHDLGSGHSSTDLGRDLVHNLGPDHSSTDLDRDFGDNLGPGHNSNDLGHLGPGYSSNDIGNNLGSGHNRDLGHGTDLGHDLGHDLAPGHSTDVGPSPSYNNDVLMEPVQPNGVAGATPEQIRKDLRSKVVNRVRKEGKDPKQLVKSSPKKPEKLSETEKQTRVRRRELNKVAAAKSRKKLKEEKESAVQEIMDLEIHNRKLQEKVDKMEKEKNRHLQVFVNLGVSPAELDTFLLKSLQS